MNIDELEVGSVDFFERIIKTLKETFPLEDPADLIVDVDLNPEKKTAAATITAPLTHPQIDSQFSKSSYSDLFQIGIDYVMCEDRTGKFLAVSQSKFELRVHTAPGIRFEYDRMKSTAPAAHIHYFGIAGILSPALVRNFSGRKSSKRNGQVADLHFPVGGHRFRPSLEDFLFFVIKECGFKGKDGWEK